MGVNKALPMNIIWKIANPLLNIPEMHPWEIKIQANDPDQSR